MDQSGELTELGKHVAREKFERDEKSPDADVGASTFILQVQQHSGKA